MEDNSTDKHRQCKDMILKTLYDNRGRLISSSKIRHHIKHIDKFNIKLNTIEAYLLELINEKMIKKEKGKGTWVDYYLTEEGLNYVENGFVKQESQSDISKLVDLNERTNELLTSILEVSHMSIEEQQRHGELLTRLTDALQNNDDGKARNILKEGLDAGKQIAIPLMVEYIKGFIPGI